MEPVGHRARGCERLAGVIGGYLVDAEPGAEVVERCGDADVVGADPGDLGLWRRGGEILSERRRGQSEEGEVREGGVLRWRAST